MSNLGMCRQLKKNFALQPIDDVADKVPDLAKLMILYKPSAVTLFEQYSYLV